MQSRAATTARLFPLPIRVVSSTHSIQVTAILSSMLAVGHRARVVRLAVSRPWISQACLQVDHLTVSGKLVMQRCQNFAAGGQGGCLKATSLFMEDVLNWVGRHLDAPDIKIDWSALVGEVFLST